MAYREITDQDGRTWRVWDTDPHQFAGRQVIAENYASGWLTFECGDEKRRLAPAPPGWEARDTAGLLRLLAQAEAIGRGVQRLSKVPSPGAEQSGGPTG